MPANHRHRRTCAHCGRGFPSLIALFEHLDLNGKCKEEQDNG